MINLEVVFSATPIEFFKIVWECICSDLVYCNYMGQSYSICSKGLLILTRVRGIHGIHEH